MDGRNRLFEWGGGVGGGVPMARGTEKENNPIVTCTCSTFTKYVTVDKQNHDLKMGGGCKSRPPHRLLDLLIMARDVKVA